MNREPERHYTTAEHQRMIDRLKRHIARYGPLSHTRHESIDANLVLWSLYVRSHILQYSPEQIDTLLESGLFNYREEEWLGYFKKLSAFACEHGHCRVPTDHTQIEVKRLGNWAYRQRKRRAKLRDFQIVLLNSLEFEWELLTKDVVWQHNYEKLKAYMAEHGHCQFKVTSEPQYLALSSWVTKQRALFSQNELEEGQIQKLNAIGFVWNPAEKRWKQRVKE